MRFLMSDQQQSHRDQRHHHHDQHHRQQSQDRQPSGHPEGQRREFLWRERVKLELQVQALAFSGIHVISPRLLSMMTEEGAFSIITSYLRLGEQGKKVLGFRADEYYWRDLGRPENVAQAEQDLKNKVL